MSYDLYAFRTNGRPLQNAMEIVMDDSGTPVSEEFHFDRDGLASALAASFPNLDRIEHDGFIMLEFGEEIPVQIGLEPHLASVTIPYWEMPPARRRGISDVLRAFDKVARSHDLTIYDPQTDAPFDLNGLEATFDTMVTTRRSVLAKIEDESRPKKPWWRFW